MNPTMRRCLPASLVQLECFQFCCVPPRSLKLGLKKPHIVSHLAYRALHVLLHACKWAWLGAQIDVFSFGVLVYEVMTGTITSQMIVGPTGDHLAAEVYALKVRACRVSEPAHV